MLKSSILIFVLLFSSSTFATQQYGNAVVSEVISIYDGDTFRVNLSNFPNLIGKNIPIRINGVDTPEMRGKCEKEKELARAAKQFTVAKLRAAKVIELKDMVRGKYFRIVADVYLDGMSLSQLLLEKGHAIRYDGGKKNISWCD
ncbi:thermonuclease family protein [Psychrosphaera aquimarina]|uniref:Thermonuclease family protein n=1 Tax=Psychrosphaera aquimarina TaxID=2044854 RepID=A0ABU3QXG7_9GAMM|nr:thermonuclease family protein [Psychrosphaera aquimarina]MDU0111743.1 thermonuclease family protein [Psychrosphaera aquimarina]